MFNSGQPPKNASTPTNGFSQPMATRVKVPRSGFRSTSFCQSNVNEPDPNGDVTLVVSPPAYLPRYKQKIIPFGSISTSPSVTTPSTESTESEPLKSRFRVSSKQLMLASAYFEKMLTPRWREGQELGANGSMELNITDTDPNTFLIILNIIHFRMARVPRVVSFDTLTELAVLADYFQCHEALEPYPSIWLERLKNNVPTMYCDELVKWIFVSWVFNYDDIFTKVTRIAQRQATGDIYLINLPIPESIYGAINNARRTALSATLAALKRRRDYLENNDQPACCADCDSLYLGTLIRLMKSYRLNIGPPYCFLSVEAAAERVSNFRQPPDIHVRKPGPVAFGTSPQTNLKLLGESTKKEIEKAISVLQGLDLS